MKIWLAKWTGPLLGQDIRPAAITPAALTLGDDPRFLAKDHQGGGDQSLWRYSLLWSNGESSSSQIWCRSPAAILSPDRLFGFATASPPLSVFSVPYNYCYPAQGQKGGCPSWPSSPLLPDNLNSGRLHNKESLLCKCSYRLLSWGYGHDHPG